MHQVQVPLDLVLDLGGLERVGTYSLLKQLPKGPSMLTAISLVSEIAKLPEASSPNATGGHGANSVAHGGHNDAKRHCASSGHQKRCNESPLQSLTFL